MMASYAKTCSDDNKEKMTREYQPTVHIDGKKVVPKASSLII
jgi:hypothetical protein